MPPVFGPVSPSPIRLKSRAGASGIARSPSHSASSESSSPSRNSSTTTGTSPNRRSTSISCSAARASASVGGDRDALARRQPVGLDHRRVAGDRGHALLDVAHDLVRRRRDAGGGHDLLGERLRALEPRGGGDRAEAAHAGGGERVGEPGDERRLGPDDDEVDPGVARRGRERGGIVRGRVERPRVAADARVAGRAQHLGRLRGAQQRPDDRVLATAGADDEDPHTAPMKSSIGIAESDS